ncbi:hypothetical protein SLA2020_380940 [Shorea laevis]
MLLRAPRCDEGMLVLAGRDEVLARTRVPNPKPDLIGAGSSELCSGPVDAEQLADFTSLLHFLAHGSQGLA